MSSTDEEQKWEPEWLLSVGELGLDRWVRLTVDGVEFEGEVMFVGLDINDRTMRNFGLMNGDKYTRHHLAASYPVSVRRRYYPPLTEEDNPGYGVILDSEDGYCVPWCKNCGAPMVDPCSPGDTEPYFDVADDEDDPECKPGHDHEPVYIWTAFFDEVRGH